MSQTASIFNPKDDSLAERVNAYRSAHEAWLNVEASLKYMEDPEWSATLGEVKEVEDAHRDIVNSLNQATQSFSVDDIGRALAEGLFNEQEASEMTSQKMGMGQGQELEQEKSF